ncbi:MAG: VWA domain-containing protein [Actinobacteria bacterium]|nr:VWA domain-containing protein [Actinomycetota bacterium]
MPEAAFTPVLAGFTQALRDEGLAVGTGDLLTYCAAAARLDPTDLTDLYWAGSATLVTKKEDREVYDRVFRRYFLARPDPVRELLQLSTQAGAQVDGAVLDVPATDPADGPGDEEEARLGLMAADAEALRRKAFGACTPEELAALRRIMRRMRLTPPRRRTRRTAAARAGRVPDLRRTVRAAMRMDDDTLRWRQRKVKLRPLILILDVSGSMADYSRSLLQFAHSARRASGRVEVFCFGTRLTRITRPLGRRRPDQALEEAGRAVLDWEGGTRIGASLDEFVRVWGRRGLARGGVVVVCSDGLDRGDPELLSTAIQRLARQCHKLVWLNPHKRDNPGFQPSTLGMMVVAPHVDLLLSGHDLRSLEELATLLPAL